jgi:hypothetical protein
MYGVNVALDDDGYTFNLLRDNKMTKIVFMNHKVQISKAKPERLESWVRERIGGEPESDGYLYYICAKPVTGYVISDELVSNNPTTLEDINKWSFVWLSKDEASILTKAVKASEMYYYNQDKYWD